MPQVDKCSEIGKSEEPASQSSEIDSGGSDENSNSVAQDAANDSSQEAEVEEQNVPNDIMSLVSITMEVEEPKRKRRKTNYSSDPENKEKRAKSNKDKSTTTASYECTFCEKTFRDKYHLTRHLFVHAGEKVPDCKLCKIPRDVCSCEPYQPILEKPHKCDRCGKTFRDKYHLNRHIFVHTREKPFKCMFCDKHFSRKDKLTQHTLLHT